MGGSGLRTIVRKMRSIRSSDGRRVRGCNDIRYRRRDQLLLVKCVLLQLLLQLLLVRLDLRLNSWGD